MNNKVRKENISVENARFLTINWVINAGFEFVPTTLLQEVVGEENMGAFLEELGTLIHDLTIKHNKHGVKA